MEKIYSLISFFFNLSSPEIKLSNKITPFESFRLGEKELSWPWQRNRLEHMIDSSNMKQRASCNEIRNLEP